MRNVGFVKVEQNDTDTVVHIHGKGLRLTGDKTLKLYIFYRDNKRCIGVWQGDIENVNPAVNYRLSYTAQDTGRPENYPLIDGLILENESQRRFAAVWNDMPVNVDEMEVWQGQEESQARHGEPPFREEEKTQGEAEPGKVKEQESQEVSKEEPAPEEQLEPEEKIMLPGEAAIEVEALPEEAASPDEEDRYINPTRKQYKKIQRQDIAALPRCEWRLANNSFLLHGYYNYHHLLLIEEDDCWLGVPGVYHPREAKAAEAFGFPRFIRVGDEEVEWAEDEKNEVDDFGYWCRQVRR